MSLHRAVRQLAHELNVVLAGHDRVMERADAGTGLHGLRSKHA